MPDDVEELALTGCAEASNKFGGQWTLDKLSAVEQYLGAYTTALKNQRFKLMYIDAFAGSGRFETKGGTTHDGSATIALAASPPFDRLVFIEQHLKRSKALQALADQHPGREIEVIRGEANVELQSLISRVNWREYRAVLFLDPFGLSVSWDTLQAIRRSEAIDVWYLCAFAGLYRQMAVDLRKIDADKEAAITRFFGTADWRRDLYEPVRTGDLFGADRSERGNLEEIRSLVTRRLRELFPRVLEPKVIRYIGPKGQKGAPLFDLYFAVSNPSPKAIAPACRIAGHILKSL